MKQKCNECTYSHYFSTKVITHFKLVHLKIPKKSITRFCDECNFQTKRQDHLKHHKDSVHEGIIHRCASFTFQSDRKANLVRHRNEKHLEISLPCDEDRYVFMTTSKSSLKTHKEAKHEGILLFRWDFMNCLFGTYKHRDYRTHRETHLQQSKIHKKRAISKTIIREKLFACIECDKTFHALSNLKEHIITHTREKQFSCSLCQKAFPLRHALKRHQLVHTREKSFICSKCNKTFSRYKALTNHQLLHQTNKIPGHVPNIDVKQIFTPISRKITIKRNFNVKSTKTKTIYRCPLDLCQFTISKQKFKETTEAGIHLMKAHVINPNNFANAPKDKFKFSRVKINKSNKL